MFNDQKKYSYDILYPLSGGIIFILIAFFISRPTANTDIYVQLIAIKGILSELDFSGVHWHPIGIATVASLFKLFNLDPLICLYYLQPVLSGLCFWILFRLLITVIPDKHAFFISLSSLSVFVFFNSMNQVTAEIISLITILLLMTYVWNNFIQNQNLNVKIVLLMVILSWIAILCRNAAIFMVIGILIFFYINNIFSGLKFLLVGTIMLLPGAIKTLFFYNSQPIHMEKIFSLSMPLEIITQLTKHFLNFTEIILPYSLHLNRIPWIKLILVLSYLLFLLLTKRYQIDSKVGDKKRRLLGNYFFTIGISYYCFLSFASICYNYDWGDLYRVSGFGILFMLNAFWLYICSYIKWERGIIVILMITSIMKVSYGLRYEILSNQHRFLYQDYRDSIKEIINYVDKGCKDIYVYTDESWQGRNLYYMLLYYDLIHSLPYAINVYSNNVIKSPSVMFCTKMDLNQFDSKQYSINKISGIEKVYAIQQ